MLHHWLQPSSVLPSQYAKHQIGAHIQPLPTEGLLTKHSIVLIGIEVDAADKVREHLYGLVHPLGNIRLTDAGNIRKPNADFVIPVLEELLLAGALPILLGGGQEMVYAQYSAYKRTDQMVNLAMVTNRIPFTAEYHTTPDPDNSYFVNRILADKESFLFQWSLLGYQVPYTAHETIAEMERRNYDLLRLGKIRRNTEEAEPYLRDADCIGFDLSAIRFVEAPAQVQSLPSGLFMDEACQLAWYAGLSNKLTSIGFYGFVPHLDMRQQTSILMAQLLWYFIDGVAQRKPDLPIKKRNFVEYIVSWKDGVGELTFWKSKLSEKWWLLMPATKDRKLRRHRLVPCSYGDYQAACTGDLPERLLVALSRF
jgi:formiminoglutamase